MAVVRVVLSLQSRALIWSTAAINQQCRSSCLDQPSARIKLAHFFFGSTVTND